MKSLIGLVGIALITAGCATTFYGDANVNGPRECHRQCDDWGMDLAGMFQAGEYSSGCICQPRPKPGQVARPLSLLDPSVIGPAVTPAIAGVAIENNARKTSVVCATLWPFLMAGAILPFWL